MRHRLTREKHRLFRGIDTGNRHGLGSRSARDVVALWQAPSMGIALLPLCAAFLLVILLCYMTDRGYSDRALIMAAAVGIGLELGAVLCMVIAGA